MSFKEKVVYQIWPRSFQDSNNDGIGDLNGIIHRLDYLKNLGVDYLWLSPIFQTPNMDYGYDISDYYTVNPEFGTMNDFKQLLQEAKQREMKIILDLVVNHTSDQHPWFQSAINDINSPYRDYYFFRPGKNNGPPNNWMGFFGGSAWQYDKSSNQYYMTTFTPQQCDLNWSNPQVRQEIYNMMKFWMEMGVAGWRMDVINSIAKADGLPDQSPELSGMQFPKDLIFNQPIIHTYLHEMYEQVLKPYNAFALGEGALVDVDDVKLYTDPQREELQLMFNFDFPLLGCGPLGKFDFRKGYYYSKRQWKAVIRKWQNATMTQNIWVGNYIANHDHQRPLKRFGNEGKYRTVSAKALALMNITLRGTPFLYQGEEIGMINPKLAMKDWKDPEAFNIYQELQKMMHLPAFIALKIVQKMTRDQSRTPIPWDNSINNGFTFGIPWMVMNNDGITVENDINNPQGVYQFYREIIKQRHEYLALNTGDYLELLENHPTIVAYRRSNHQHRLEIVINLSKRKQKVNLNEIDVSLSEVIINNYEVLITKGNYLYLEPFQAIMCLKH